MPKNKNKWRWLGQIHKNYQIKNDGYILVTDVHEIYTIKYSYIYIFGLTFMLFCDWLYNIFVLQVTKALHAKWG